MAWKHFSPMAELMNFTTSSTFYIRRVRYQDTVPQEVIDKTRLCFCIGKDFNPIGSGMHTPQHPIAVWLSYIDGTAYSSTSIYQMVNGSDTTSSSYGQKYVTDRNLTMQASAVSEQYPIVWMEGQSSPTVANPDIISNYVTSVRDELNDSLRLALFKLYNPYGMPVFDTWDDAVGYLYTDDPEDYIKRHDIFSGLDTTTHWKVYMSPSDLPNISIVAHCPGFEGLPVEDQNNASIIMRIQGWAHEGLITYDFDMGTLPYNIVETSFNNIYYNYTSSTMPFWRSYIRFRMWIEIVRYDENGEQITLRSDEVIADVSKNNNSVNNTHTDGAFGSTVTFVLGTPNEDEPYIIPDNPTPPDPDDDDLDINLSGFGISQYCMTNAKFRSVLGKLWSTDFLDNLKKFNNDPVNNIISAIALPWGLPFDSTQFYNVVVGNVDLGVQNVRRLSGKNVISLGSVDIEPLYNNFLDYLTGLTLYLPYVGFCPIDAKLCMGKTVAVKYYVDTLTGACDAVVFVNQVSEYKFSGQFGLEIPLSASDFSGKYKGLFNTVGTTIGGLVTGGAPGAIGGLVGGLASTAMSRNSQNQTQCNLAMCSVSEPQQAMVIYDRPIVQIPARFNHTHGRPCNLTRNLSGMSGFTKLAESVDLSGIVCTDEERQELYDILTSGFYL